LCRLISVGDGKCKSIAPMGRRGVEGSDGSGNLEIVDRGETGGSVLFCKGFALC